MGNNCARSDMADQKALNAEMCKDTDSKYSKSQDSMQSKLKEPKKKSQGNCVGFCGVIASIDEEERSVGINY